MIDPAKTIESIQKLAPKTLLALGLATGAILFAPVTFIQGMQLEVLRGKFGFWTGAICLVCWSLLAMHSLWSLIGALSTRRNRRRLRNIRQGHLKKLTPDEKGFLKPYISEEETTRHAVFDDGVVNGLKEREIVFRAANPVDPQHIPFNLQPWARDYLMAHVDLLEGGTQYPPKRSAW